MGGQTGRTESGPLLNRQVCIGNRFIQIKCNKVLNRIQNFGISLEIENKQCLLLVTSHPQFRLLAYKPAWINFCCGVDECHQITKAWSWIVASDGTSVMSIKAIKEWMSSILLQIYQLSFVVRRPRFYVLMSGVK